MSIRFRYHAERDLLVHVGDGHVGIEDIRDLRARRRSEGVPRSVARTLTDMRRAVFDFDIATLRAHEEGLAADEFAGAKHAEVVVDVHPTAILLLWKQWLPDGVHVEVFSTIEAAYEWLGVEYREDDLDI
jgi:hypothetical protein